jgi:hypothetical protein
MKPVAPPNPKSRRKAPKNAANKPQRSVWSGIKRKGGVSPLQLHLPGLGGIIQ